MDIVVSIKNFKSIRSVRFPIRKGVNILVGPNGSGKTCILSALTFLGDVLRLGAAHAMARGGGANRVYNRGRRFLEFTASCAYGERTYKRRKYPFHMSWRIKIAQRGKEKVATIVYERLALSLNEEGNTREILDVTIDRAVHRRRPSSIGLKNLRHFHKDLFQSPYMDVGRLSGKRARVKREVQSLMREFKDKGDTSIMYNLAAFDRRISDVVERLMSLEEYRIIPDIARTPTDQLEFARMSTDGAGVSEVIYALENEHYHRISEGERYYVPSQYPHYPYHKSPRSWLIYRREYLYRRREDYWRRLTRALSLINVELGAAVRPIETVGAEVDVSTGRRRLVFRSSNGDKFHAEEVSDGTMKWICILVSILVGNAAIYLLEEPENFLHPWMQQRLIQIMREEARCQERAFLLSSHSATILNATKPSELLIVVQSKRGTQIREIEDKMRIEETLAEAKFGLGDLWVSGAIGGVPGDA